MVAVAQGGCAHGRGIVVGRITPWHFRFKTVVPVDASEAQPDGSEAQPGEMIAILCRRFKEEYQKRLWENVAGARVSECRTRGIETVYFDIPARSSADE
jgi:hypothetical protein